MSAYTCSDDIYNELVDESEENWLYGLVAFAIFEEQRIEWMKHYKELNNKAPTATEIKNWYKQHPKSSLVRVKGEAESALRTYSEEVLDMILDEVKSEVYESALMEEIKSTKKFLPQFGINIAGGFASAILFAALLILAVFFVNNDTSAVELGEKIQYHNGIDKEQMDLEETYIHDLENPTGQEGENGKS